jgi:hypothetical protein
MKNTHQKTFVFENFAFAVVFAFLVCHSRRESAVVFVFLSILPDFIACPSRFASRLRYKVSHLNRYEIAVKAGTHFRGSITSEFLILL